MLIVTQDGRSTRIQRERFQDEAALQGYISAHPEAIPLSESGDEPELHVLGREFPTASGPIDILGTDAVGEAYIIETKLYKNPDKRLVLAQVLDYGAALWAAEPGVEVVLQALRHDAERRAAPEPLNSLAEFLGGDEEAAGGHLAKVCDGLADGRFTAIILMDRLDDRLRDLIRFINEKSRFRILALELDYYRHGAAEIVYPRLFGAETRRPADRAARPRRPPADPEAFFQEYAAKFGAEPVGLWRSFEQSALTSDVPGLEVGHLPQGSPYLYLSGTVIGEVRVLRLAGQAEVRDLLSFNTAGFEANPKARDAQQRFRRRLVELVPGAKVGGTVQRIFMPLASLAEHRAEVLSAIGDLAQALGAQPAGPGPSPGGA